MSELQRYSIVEYGSCVRKDNDRHSDRDILVVYQTGAFPYSLLPKLASKGYACSVYSQRRLTELAKSGSLFVKHLVNESRIKSDSDLFLASLFDGFQLRSNYCDTFESAVSIFGLLEFIPNSPRGLSWASDVLAVAFRSMAIPYLADKGLFVFGMKDICHALRSLGLINRTETQSLLALRLFKSQHRKQGNIQCTTDEISGVIKVVDRCFGIGIHRRFVSMALIRSELHVNSPGDWYRGVRLLEALCLHHSHQPSIYLESMRKIIVSPQIYGWQMKHCTQSVLTTAHQMIANSLDCVA